MDTTVRAAVLSQSGLAPPYENSRPITVHNLVLEPPSTGELMIDIRAAGLCHSDLSVIDGSRPRGLPLVLGHEAAGVVSAVGDGVDDFAVGDHVVLSFVPSCGACRPCMDGRPALCEPGAAANTRGTLLSGRRPFRSNSGAPLNHHLGVSAFGERTVISSRSAIKVDPALSFEIAALFGCAVITGVGAVLNAARVQPGESVAVFGLGGVGLSALIGARLAGAAPLLAVDTVPEKLVLARELGATATVLAGDGAVDAIREMTAGGAERVIETVGAVPVLSQAYAATRRGGTTVTVGLPAPDRELALPAVGLVTEERTLRGSYLGSGVPARDIPRLVGLHREGLLPVDRLLTHRLSLEDLNVGFDRLARGEAVRQLVVI